MRVRIEGYDLAEYETSRFIGNLLTNDYPHKVRKAICEYLLRDGMMGSYAIAVVNGIQYELCGEIAEVSEAMFIDVVTV